MASHAELTQTTLRNHHKSVASVVIHQKNGTLAGSGFIAREATEHSRALVMTADHVVEFFEPAKNDKLCIRLPGLDRELECEIRHRDNFKDLAAIAVSGVPDGYPALRFSRERDLPIGTAAVLVAYYNPDKLAKTKGPILVKPGACGGTIVGPPVRITKNIEWTERIRHECATMSGCSGGPVIVNGHVVGVNQYGDNTSGLAASFVTVEAVVKNWAQKDGDHSLDDLLKYL
ncbi:hypothetical protein CFC21_066645 [Triticum aestivum]|uniref:Serine protease n=2 Tax=Triticum aestivum TaxID=4565 RepID=A0A9R1KMT2_WHEAT|nr:uncharacterized protein LOC119297612 [Triticum dicoccoides]KAF7059782.1 hypothetical protein CFC21_066645 [Triticum aestivum]